MITARDGERVAVAPGIEEVRFPGWRPPEPVMVSVNVQTYQHGSYIRQCLQAICDQQTDFAFEVLVGEDGSTDETREVCLEFARRYPDKIRLWLHDRSNVIRIHGVATGRFNGMCNMERGQGKYIAICEGDDFWTDPQKLQKQVDFLESHPDHMFAYHDAVKVDPQGNIISGRILGSALCYDRPQNRVVAGDHMPTASVMFRREMLRNLPAGFRTIMNADTYLFSYGGQFGRAGFVDVRPSGYRVHGGGIWSVREQTFRIRSNLNTFKTLYPDLLPEFRPVVGYQVTRNYNRLFWHQLRAGKLIAAGGTCGSFLLFAIRRLGLRVFLYQARWLASVMVRGVKSLRKGRGS